MSKITTLSGFNSAYDCHIHSSADSGKPINKAVLEDKKIPSGRWHNANSSGGQNCHRQSITVHDISPAPFCQPYPCDSVSCADDKSTQDASQSFLMAASNKVSITEPPSESSVPSGKANEPPGNGAGNEPPEQPTGTASDTSINEYQQLVDDLINAAEQGATDKVTGILRQHGTALLEGHHSHTGNTALHAAIIHNQSDIVGAIMHSIKQETPATVTAVSLLNLKDTFKKTPLEYLPQNQTMTQELLASLSILWPYCAAHQCFTLLHIVLECGCRVCETCKPSISPGETRCLQCRQTLGEGEWCPDSYRLRETRRDVQKYQQLFSDENLAHCTVCSFPAFPPVKSDCGHAFCETCFQRTKTCPANRSEGQTCQNILQRSARNSLSYQRFIALFSAKSPYAETLREREQYQPSSSTTVETSAAGNPVVQPSQEDEAPTFAIATSSWYPADMQALEATGAKAHETTVSDVPAVASNPHYKAYEGLSDNMIEKITRREYKIIVGPDAIKTVTRKLQAASDRASLQQQREEIEKEFLAPAFADASNGAALLKHLGRHQGVVTIDGIPFNYTTSKTFKNTGIFHSIGRRAKIKKGMEDRDLTQKVMFKQLIIDIIGIFDGHGGHGLGEEMVDYAVNRLHFFLEKRLEEIDILELTVDDIWNLLKIIFVDVSRTCHKETTGTTANVAFVINQHLWIANVGDSRAIWIDEDGTIIQLSEDAKPYMKRFEHSIKKRGGSVTITDCPRVNGILASARAMCDHYLDGAVSARPTLICKKCRRGILLQVCDGLTDVARTLDLAKAIQKYIYEENDTPAIAAMKLGIKAYNAGSKDNLSVIVTLFDENGIVEEHSSFADAAYLLEYTDTASAGQNESITAAEEN